MKDTYKKNIKKDDSGYYGLYIDSQFLGYFETESDAEEYYIKNLQEVLNDED